MPLPSNGTHEDEVEAVTWGWASPIWGWGGGREGGGGVIRYLRAPYSMKASANMQQRRQHPVHMICEGVVMAERGRGGGSLLLGVEGSWALDERGCALAAVLDEIKVVIQLPARLLTAHLCSHTQWSLIFSVFFLLSFFLSFFHSFVLSFFLSVSLSFFQPYTVLTMIMKAMAPSYHIY